jgi:hypothetical protein
MRQRIFIFGEAANVVVHFLLLMPNEDTLTQIHKQHHTTATSNVTTEGENNNYNNHTNSIETALVAGGSKLVNVLLLSLDSRSNLLLADKLICKCCSQINKHSSVYRSSQPNLGLSHRSSLLHPLSRRCFRRIK